MQIVRDIYSINIYHHGRDDYIVSHDVPTREDCITDYDKIERAIYHRNYFLLPSYCQSLMNDIITENVTVEATHYIEWDDGRCQEFFFIEDGGLYSETDLKEIERQLAL